MQNLPIIAPCDTIYGFIGRVPFSEEAIRQIKGREENKPFLILINRSDISAFSDQSLPESILSYWPGALTVIVRSNQEWQERGLKTIALRYPNDPWLLQLMESVQTPLYSTSCNRSGNPVLREVKKIIAEFEADLPLIVEAGDCIGVASTVIDCSVVPYRIVREGAVKIDLQQL